MHTICRIYDKALMKTEQFEFSWPHAHKKLNRVWCWHSVLVANSTFQNISERLNTLGMSPSASLFLCPPTGILFTCVHDNTKVLVPWKWDKVPFILGPCAIYFFDNVRYMSPKDDCCSMSGDLSCTCMEIHVNETRFPLFWALAQNMFLITQDTCRWRVTVARYRMICLVHVWRSSVTKWPHKTKLYLLKTCFPKLCDQKRAVLKYHKMFIKFDLGPRLCLLI